MIGRFKINSPEHPYYLSLNEQRYHLMLKLPSTLFLALPVLPVYLSKFCGQEQVMGGALLMNSRQIYLNRFSLFKKMQLSTAVMHFIRVTLSGFPAMVFFVSKRLLGLSIYPVQYQPKKRNLPFMGLLQIEVTYGGTKRVPTKGQIADSEACKCISKRLTQL